MSKLFTLPPEVLISVLQFVTIQDVHAFQLVCSFANEIIQNQSSTVYRNVAIFYGLAPKDQRLDNILSSRNIRYDFLKETVDDDGLQITPVKTWKEYVMRHFLIERNWVEGECLQRTRGFDGRGPHRIQIDEAEGSVINTYATGGIFVEDMHLQEADNGSDELLVTNLWSNEFARQWTHVEFDNGFLIWGRDLSEIQVWRRTSDQLSDPLPAYNPSDRQKHEHQETVLRLNELNEEEPTMTRGWFDPFTLIVTPTPTAASRFVYPHLVVATRDCSFAYVYDVPNNQLVKTIKLEDSKGLANLVYYVEHSQKHVFVVSPAEVKVYNKSDGRRIFTLNQETPVDQALEVDFGDSYTSRMTSRTTYGLLGPDDSEQKNIADYQEAFLATHISPCGRIWVVMLQAVAIFVITGFDEDEEPLHITGINLWEKELQYLAFDGHHIATAGNDGIYTISLNRFRDPGLPLKSIHEALPEETPVRLYPQSEPELPYTSCLQITDTAIWFVAGPSQNVVTSAVCSLDFTRKPEPSTNSEFEIQVVSQRLEDLEQDPWAEDLESASESGSE